MDQLFWLSFRDPELNKWLGGCFVQSDSAMNAVDRTVDLEINPGGEVVVTPGVEICKELIKELNEEGYVFDYLYKTKEELPGEYERMPV